MSKESFGWWLNCQNLVLFFGIFSLFPVITWLEVTQISRKIVQCNIRWNELRDEELNVKKTIAVTDATFTVFHSYFVLKRIFIGARKVIPITHLKFTTTTVFAFPFRSFFPWPQAGLSQSLTLFLHRNLRVEERQYNSLGQIRRSGNQVSSRETRGISLSRAKSCILWIL